MAWFKRWPAKRRFGSCVKVPEANCSNSHAKPKPRSARSSPLSRCPRHARRSAKARLINANTAHGKRSGAAHCRFEQFLATTLQMPDALLMEGPCEAVVHAPAVMHQCARPVEPQQLFGRCVAPGGIDHITRRTLTDEGVQPSQTSADTPARFIRRNLRRAAQVDSQLFVGGSATPGCTQHRAHTGSSGKMQFREQCPQQLHALAMRQAQLFVEHRQQGMHLRTELTRRGAAAELICKA